MESGHKEELSGVLGEQYESAYSQAKAAQAQTTGAAQATYAKNVASFAESASKTATSYYESAIKEAEKRAKLYKAAEVINFDGKYYRKDIGKRALAALEVK